MERSDSTVQQIATLKPCKTTGIPANSVSIEIMDIISVSVSRARYVLHTLYNYWTRLSHSEQNHRLRSIRWFTRGNFCPPVSASDLSLYYACVNLW